MATRAQIEAQLLTLINDNTSQDITPQDVRDAINLIKDNSLNTTEDLMTLPEAQVGTDTDPKYISAKVLLDLVEDKALLQSIHDTDDDGVIDVAERTAQDKGLFASLVELQLAHPTAADGDYARVEVAGAADLHYIWDDNDSVWRIKGGDMLKSEYATNGRTGEVDTANRVFMRDPNDPDPVTSIKGTLSTDGTNVGLFATGDLGVVAQAILQEIASYSSANFEQYRHGLIVGLSRLLVGSTANDNSEQIAELRSGNGADAPGIRVTADQYTEVFHALRLLAGRSSVIPEPDDITEGDRIPTVNPTTGQVVYKLMTALSAVSALSDLGDVDLTGLAANDSLQYDGTTWVPLKSVSPHITDGTLKGEITGLSYTDNVATVDPATLSDTVSELQTFIASGYLYQVVSIVGSTATVVRHELAPSGAGGASYTATKAIGIGGAAVSITEDTDNPGAFTITSDGDAVDEVSADNIAFYDFGVFSGDGGVLVEVRDVAGRADTAEVGIMWRESFAPGALYSAAGVYRNGTADLAVIRERTARDAASSNESGGGFSGTSDDNISSGGSLFIKVDRAGSTITVSMDYSEDFSSARTDTFTWAGPAHLGLYFKAGSGTEDIYVKNYRFIA